MEQLLHYVWKHKLFPLCPLETSDGQSVEVIDTGLHNHNAGPDFFNAKVKINGTQWVGNVEIHQRASDWYAHHHDNDDAYNNVILHVCEVIDADVRTHNGRLLPQLQLSVPKGVADNYQQLLATMHYPPCYRIIPDLPKLVVHAWMSALQTERLEQKTKAIAQRLSLCNGSWEAACFVTMARNFGFGINSDAFEHWAMAIPLDAVGHHRDDLFQIEAIFMGQAGLLDPLSISEAHRQAALSDDYFQRLGNEYAYLAHKFSLHPIDHHEWRFLRLRPQNFPYIRIAQLANLYYNRRASLSQLLECTTIDQLHEALATQVTPYWQTHYTFGAPSKKSEKRLSHASIDILLVNTVIPLLFAYGRFKSSEALCDRAFELLEQLKAEQNNITRLWHECGIDVDSAADSQALIQLKREYCDRKDCLRCRFGYEFMKKSNSEQQ